MSTLFTTYSPILGEKVSTFKVDTYSPNTGEKLYTFALSPIVVENHRVYFSAGAIFYAFLSHCQCLKQNLVLIGSCIA